VTSRPEAETASGAPWHCASPWVAATAARDPGRRRRRGAAPPAGLPPRLAESHPRSRAAWTRSVRTPGAWLERRQARAVRRSSSSPTGPRRWTWPRGGTSSWPASTSPRTSPTPRASSSMGSCGPGGRRPREGETLVRALAGGSGGFSSSSHPPSHPHRDLVCATLAWVAADGGQPSVECYYDARPRGTHFGGGLLPAATPTRCAEGRSAERTHLEQAALAPPALRLRGRVARAGAAERHPGRRRRQLPLPEPGRQHLLPRGLRQRDHRPAGAPSWWSAVGARPGSGSVLRLPGDRQRRLLAIERVTPKRSPRCGSRQERGDALADRPTSFRGAPSSGPTRPGWPPRRRRGWRSGGRRRLTASSSGDPELVGTVDTEPRRGRAGCRSTGTAPDRRHSPAGGTARQDRRGLWPPAPRTTTSWPSRVSASACR